MLIDGAELTRICRGLVEMAEAEDDNRAEMAKLLHRFFGLSGLKVVEVADKLGITDQTIYRWLRTLGGKPKATYMRRLRGLIEEKIEAIPEPLPRVIRIGIPPQWDSALISAFEIGFAAHNVTPQFIRLPTMHSAVHRAFRDGRIDVAIQSHFLVQYDHALKQLGLSDSLGLSIRQLLFVFSGYYIYAHRRAVVAAACQEDTPSHARRGLEKLLNEGQYAWFTADPEERKAGCAAVLKGAHVGVERWTGMELALRAAYERVGLSFTGETEHAERETAALWRARINIREDTLGGMETSINSQQMDPNFVNAVQALEAFREGVVGVFCGGLAQHHYLRSHPGHGENNRSSDPPAAPYGDPQYLILMRPNDIGVSSYNGVIAREDLDEEIVQIVARVWQGGTRLFRRWSSEILDPDLRSGSQAMSQLAAMLRVDEGAVPEDLRVMDADLIQTARWREWNKRLPNLDKESLTKAGVDFYREDWRQRVREWSALLNEHCKFFETQAEARAAFARRHQDQGEEWAEFLYNQMTDMAKTLARSRLDRPLPTGGLEFPRPPEASEAPRRKDQLQTLR